MNWAMPLLRRLDAEQAHGLALLALRHGWAGQAPKDAPRLATPFLGRMLANPIGLAAGFDKDARAVAGLTRIGFGFVELGTVTRHPQPGNPRPRLFRLAEDDAIINRMGFNNGGIEAFVQSLREAQPLAAAIGVNIGLNKVDADPERDYPALAAAVQDYAAYVTINVSSPNTPGLRDLQAPGRLASILGAIHDAVPRAPPLFVKLAPDVDDGMLPDIVGVCVDHGARGLVICNTTVARPPTLRSRHAGEAGGLSGAPLRGRAVAMLLALQPHIRGRLAVIAVGGIRCGHDILMRLCAGANAVQIYSALALEGPSLLPRLKQELVDELQRAGLDGVADAVSRSGVAG